MRTTIPVGQVMTPRNKDWWERAQAERVALTAAPEYWPRTPQEGRLSQLGGARTCGLWAVGEHGGHVCGVRVSLGSGSGACPSIH